VSTLVVTIAGPEKRVDLSVPGETPIGQLMPTFLSLGVVSQNGNGTLYGLTRSGGQPLPEASTLAACGVVDGEVLTVVEVKGEEAPPPPPPRVVPAEQVNRELEQRDLRRRAGFPIGRTEAVLPGKPTFSQRFSAAVSAFMSKEATESAPVPPPPGAAGAAPPVARPIDLTVTRPPSRMDRARASWRETNYQRRLEGQIATPRRRRCPTIAVVSPKGGVGKTTMTALLGALLVKVRHERVVAVDTNPDYGSLGRALTPDHRVFVDDLVDVLDHPDLTVTELYRKLGRAFEGLLVVPAPTDPARMARLDRKAYTKVFERLQTMVEGLVLDCGTGLNEPAAQAAIQAADQIVIVSDSEPSTASLVAEAAQLLARSGAPMFLVVNKLPRRGGRLDLNMLSRAIPQARALIAMDAEPEAASRLAAGDFSWDDAPDGWQRSVRELAVMMVADWPELGIAG
jgi:MinD-like ATPase involved in chromosome partitioning or flagellar assembly